MKRKVMVVPDCPFCKSHLTGRKIYYSGYRNEEVIARYMKAGELVEPTPLSIERNLFCLDCGLEWSGLPGCRKVDKAGLEEIKRLKGIDSEAVDTLENSIVENKLENRKKKRHKKNKGIAIPKTGKKLSLGSAAKYLLKETLIAPITDALPKDKKKKEEEETGGLNVNTRFQD